MIGVAKLPDALEAEQALLGAILVNNAAYATVAELVRPAHFTEKLHGEIYRIIGEMVSAGRGISPVTLRPFLPDSGLPGNMTTSQYVARLAAEAVNVISAPDYAKTIVDTAARRAIIGECETMITAAYGPLDGPAGIGRIVSNGVDGLLKAMDALPNAGGRKTRLDLSTAMGRALEAAEAAMERGGGLTGLNWGLTDLNRATGGLQRKDLTVIGARPSMGKTTLGLSAALRVAMKGDGVAFFSLEMDAEKLGARAITDLAYDMGVAVPYQDLIRGVCERSALSSLARARQQFDHVPLWVEDQAGLSISDIRVKTEAIAKIADRNGTKLGAIVVDHLGLVRSSDRYFGNRNNEIAEMTAALKSMAREYDIATVLLVQLNRQVENREEKRPQLSDLRDSGAIEQDADTIIFLYREAYYLERIKPKSTDDEIARINRLADVQNKLEAIIAKQRNGPLKTVELFADMGCAAVRNGAW